MQSYVEMKKLRPKTTKTDRQKSASNRPKTSKVNKYIQQNEEDFKPMTMKIKQDYRFLRPASGIKDREFNQYWQEKDLNTIKKLSGHPFSGPIPTENLLSNPILVDYNKTYETGNINKSLYKFPKIDWEKRKTHNFLSTVGGTETKLTNFFLNLSSQSNNFSFNTNNTTNILNSRPQSTTIFSNNNLVKRPLTTTNPINKNRINSASNQPPLIIKDRPVTANTSKQPPLSGKKSFRPFSGKETMSIHTNNADGKILKDYQAAIDELIEDSLSIGDLDNPEKDVLQQKSKISFQEKKRCLKVENLLNNYSKINVKEKSIKLIAADTDLLDIFDRSQRTRAATLAKSGDFDYYTPFQRIGCFMDFCMFLKWIDLKNIQKTVVDTSNYVGYLTTKKSNDTNNNFSLFHGFMRNEGEWKSYNEALISNPKLTYDPEVFLPKAWNTRLFDPQNWGEDKRNKIMISINNYNKYLNSDKIILDDLHPFDNSLKKKFLSHIEADYRRYPYLIESLFEEIIEIYYITLKNIILEYILISPYERNRLNIQYLPKKALPSSFIIASHGSFNRTLYPGWVENYFKTSEFLSKNLYNTNIITASLIDWTQCFIHINFFYTRNLDVFLVEGKKTIHIDEFYNIQANYMMKNINFLRDIFYRGVILILKKNKTFKRKLSIDGRWTFKGYVNKEISEEFNKIIINTESNDSQIYKNTDFNNEDYGMGYTDEVDDFWSNIKINDLVDIRITPSYFAYVTFYKKEKIDLSHNEYDKLSVDNKLKINNCATAYVSIFFRNLLEKSVENLVNFFYNYKYNEDIFNKIVTFYPLNEELHFKKNEIKLPELKAFQLRNYVDPIINIKIVWDTRFNTIKLEHSIDKIQEMMLKLIDNCIQIFNSFCTTHFLDFKSIDPNEIEKVQKDHWSRVNEIFLDLKAKTFVPDYFLNFAPNIIIEEIKTHNYMKTYLHIGEKNEIYFTELKNKLSKHIKRHYSEIEECLKIFKPLKELINSSLQESMNIFLDIISSSPDFPTYSMYMEKINNLRLYIVTIPNFINYSLFAADTREVKKEMLKKLDELQLNLLSKLEETVFGFYTNIIQKYSDLKKLIDHRLMTPEEIAEMEKVKLNMVYETNIIHRDFDDSYKIIHYLLSIDHIFSDNLIFRTDEVIKTQKKFRDFFEEQEKLHQRDRDNLEKKHREEKKELENEVHGLNKDINELETMVHITEYDIVSNYIVEIEKKVEPLQNRITVLLKNEELLFNFRVHSFEEFEKGLTKLYKYSSFWKKASAFYEHKKSFVLNFGEETDIAATIEFLNDTYRSLYELKPKIRKDEDALNKCMGLLEEDILFFKELILTINNLVVATEINEELKNRVWNILESKKLEPSSRQILTYVLQQQKIIF